MLITFIFVSAIRAYIHRLVRTVSLKIGGMAGLECAVHVLRVLGAVPTVKSVYVAPGEATVELEESSDQALLQAIEATGVFTAKLKISPVDGATTQMKKWFLRKVNILPPTNKPNTPSWGEAQNCKV